MPKINNNVIEYLPKIMFILLVLSGFSLGVLAREVDDKIVNLIEDDTLKTYERKSVLLVNDIAIASKKVEVLPTYCKVSNKKRKCVDDYTWNYFIDYDTKSKMESLLQKSLLGARYDKVFVAKDTITIELPNDSITITSNNNFPFSYDYGGEEDFRNKVEYFLEKITKPLSKILEESKEDRYQQMSNIERNSFIADKAKAINIPVQFLHKLMNSSFAFFMYMPNIKGSVLIDKIVPENENRYFHANLKVSTKAKLLMYRFNAETNKFIHYKDIYESVRASFDKQYSFKPKAKDMQKWFAPTLIRGTSKIIKNMKYKLSKDDNFTIFTPIWSKSGNRLEAKIGTLEDLKIDAPYIVRKSVNGFIRQTGFAKARFVFDNKYARSSKAKTEEQLLGYSSFDLVKGSSSIVSSLKEHSWTGNFSSFGVGVQPFNSSLVSDNNFFGIQTGILSDLGFILNSPSFSEIWTDGRISYSLPSATEFESSKDTLDISTYLISASFRISKRFYLGSSGAYVSSDVGIGYSNLYFEKLGSSYEINSYDFITGAKLGLNINPDKEIQIETSYAMSFMGGLINSNDNKIQHNITRGLSIYARYIYMVTF